MHTPKMNNYAQVQSTNNDIRWVKHLHIIPSGARSILRSFELLNHHTRLPQWIELHHRLQRCQSKWGTSMKNGSSYNVVACRRWFESVWLLCELLKHRTSLPQWIELHRSLQRCQSKWGTSLKKDSSYNVALSLNSTLPLNFFFATSKMFVGSWLESALPFTFTSDSKSCGLSTD